MEPNNGNSPSCKKPLEVSTSEKEVKEPTDNNSTASVFVNHAAIAWQQNRRDWIGDRSQRSKRIPQDPIIKRIPQDPIISWSATYEDLLSTAAPFAKPIPLPELVDFLVDIWNDEGLYD